MTPYQGESDGVSAGGKWLEFHSTDKMTGAKKVRFELQSDNYFSEDPEYKPRVNLYCSDGKLKLADFNPGVKLPPPNRPGWWDQPQLEVEVRVDDAHYFKGWNWMRGHFLSMDKGTVRGMMGAQIFNVALPTRSGRQIAEFSPAGLNFGSSQTSLRPDAEEAEQGLRGCLIQSVGAKFELAALEARRSALGLDGRGGPPSCEMPDRLRATSAI